MKLDPKAVIRQLANAERRGRVRDPDGLYSRWLALTRPIDPVCSTVAFGFVARRVMDDMVLPFPARGREGSADFKWVYHRAVAQYGASMEDVVDAVTFYHRTHRLVAVAGKGFRWEDFDRGDLDRTYDRYIDIGLQQQARVAIMSRPSLRNADGWAIIACAALALIVAWRAVT